MKKINSTRTGQLKRRGLKQRRKEVERRCSYWWSNPASQHGVSWTGTDPPPAPGPPPEDSARTSAGGGGGRGGEVIQVQHERYIQNVNTQSVSPSTNLAVGSVKAVNSDCRRRDLHGVKIKAWKQQTANQRKEGKKEKDERKGKKGNLSEKQKKMEGSKRWDERKINGSNRGRQGTGKKNLGRKDTRTKLHRCFRCSLAAFLSRRQKNVPMILQHTRSWYVPSLENRS